MACEVYTKKLVAGEASNHLSHPQVHSLDPRPDKGQKLFLLLHKVVLKVKVCEVYTGKLVAGDVSNHLPNPQVHSLDPRPEKCQKLFQSLH